MSEPTQRTPSAPFDGRHALIYGAAQGIGRAVSREFARRGARVSIADIDEPGAQEAVALIKSSGGSAMAMACDVTVEQSVQAAAAQAEQAFGDVDIVMNNVGAIVNGNPEDIPTAEWRRLMDLSFFSIVHSNQIFLPKMIGRGHGHIVNTASFAGLYPYAASRIPYAAAKAAVIALSESLAIYLHPLGVRVSCLCPGPVMTNVTSSMKTWSTDVTFRGPGSQYKVIEPEQAAVILADGMRDGRVVIPTDDQVWEVIRRHAASPDAFIDDQIDKVARGDLGRPSR